MTEYYSTSNYYYYKHYNNIIAVPRQCNAIKAYKIAINKVREL